MLKKPVNTWTSAEDTKIATESRSRPCLTERTGGQRKRFGYTDQSFTSKQRE